MKPEQLAMATRTRGDVGIGAVPPHDERYRYFLDRPIQPKASNQAVCFLMLNPSTADAHADDQTITRCIRYAEHWGYGWLHVVNLSPMRGTRPGELPSTDPKDVATLNLRWVVASARSSDKMVLAYGTLRAARSRFPTVLDTLRQEGCALYCLEHTKEGHPRHPSRARGDLWPSLWRGQ